MKLEKFDLEKALNGAKVVTRDGREVKELTKFESLNDDYPLIGILNGCINSWTTQGLFDTYHGESDADLFLAVEPQRIWVNLYRRDGALGFGIAHKTEKEALMYAENSKSYIKTIEITDEL